MSNILTAVPGHTAEPGNTGVTGYQLDRQEMHCSPGTGGSVHMYHIETEFQSFKENYKSGTMFSFFNRISQEIVML